MAKPNVYYFNPTCELSVANGSFSYVPPLLLQEMESDLAILPFVFATENDFVLTENLPSDGFVNKLKDAGYDLPRFYRLVDLEVLPTGSFGTIYPWGWSPAAHFKLKNLKEKCDDNFKVSPVFTWRNDHQQLFERSTSLDFLTDILNQNPSDWFIDRSFIGEKVTSCEEIELLLEKHSPIVIKAPMSSSGRGIQIIRKTRLSASNRQWISGIIKQQNYLTAEPFLEKLIDLSFQFEVLSKSEINYLGYSVFETNSNGQYKGTLIHPDFKSILPGEDPDEVATMIETTAIVVLKALKKSVFANFHRGFLGVDALIFKHQEQLRIQPCMEINSRMNMGILTKFLEKKIHPDATGKFELFYGLPGDYWNFEKQQVQLNPVKLQDGQFFSGYLSLVESTLDKKFGAYISLGTAR
ncbi:MAG TPA: hypothetical protein VF373_13975 [Prolixibacteraceae bacterium]